ncbi:haloacid dehalogenase type II [Saccharopolyspora sp. TS4A08]|uniref:Haloacid dehalogenase type II n=1 Tax=Saccharopolyspora ipomoeae TaxID=3042027 RepID=A0ABT6PNK3_9PSEU|nr:haloacid dehalogenase type II [Saccharopolyspora sp. TS4A08]MDI2029592.1 haloacid dehalogenase type II [Saccharopolyspora sp. TS4A08]
MSLDVSRLNVLLFDVLGTVVDERGSLLAATREAVGEGGDALATAWLDRLNALVAETDDYRPMDELNLEALRHAAETSGASLDEAALTALAEEGLRPKPWPDAAPGVGALADRFTVVALSNSTVRSLAEITRRGGLRWALALSSEQVGAYKPDPAVYQRALELLRVEPDQALMVASHSWDLRAAAKLGIATAYITRDGEDDDPAEPDEFDLHAETIAELAGQLL